MNPLTQPITLLVCALGGEGGGVLTEWLVDIARHAGYAAQSTSIPGVAQRTGATTYYIEVFPVPLAELGGRKPVFSLSPVPGALDAMISSELLETARQIGNGMASPERTLVISSTSRSLTTAERSVMGDGREDDQRLLGVVRQFSREHHLFDMSLAAKESGTIVSAVMLGAIAGSGLYPFPREAYEFVVRGGDTQAPEKVSKMAAASLRGFARAFDAVQAPRGQAAMLQQILQGEGDDLAPAAPARLHESIARDFPPALHALVAMGHARVVDYQDVAYGELYLDRLRQVLAAERLRDASGAQGHATTHETARWLALWMAFDDIVRVAELKSRATRADRVRREVRAQDADLVKVYDHFKPGAPEFAAMLPRGLADRVLAWDKRRAEPWSLPLKIGSHSLRGMLALRLLARMRGLRRIGTRFAEEQALIVKWLDAVMAAAKEDWRLGHEVAQCGRLIKGYGSTNERGKRNLLHVTDHLARGWIGDGTPAARADAIAAAREAALADEGGKALDLALQRHGAPARPVVAQPIRWMKRRPVAKAP